MKGVLDSGCEDIQSRVSERQSEDKSIREKKMFSWPPGNKRIADVGMDSYLKFNLAL